MKAMLWACRISAEAGEYNPQMVWSNYHIVCPRFPIKPLTARVTRRKGAILSPYLLWERTNVAWCTLRCHGQPRVTRPIDKLALEQWQKAVHSVRPDRPPRSIPSTKVLADHLLLTRKYVRACSVSTYFMTIFMAEENKCIFFNLKFFPCHTLPLTNSMGLSIGAL